MLILITPEEKRLEMGKCNSPNLSVREGFQCLGHSNWTICSLLSQFCSLNFPNLSLSYCRSNSYYPRERMAENLKMEFSKPEWDTGDSATGAFKLDYLQPVKPILLWNFSNFWLSYPRAHFLITPGGKMRKVNYPKLTETQGIQFLGHSNWTICILLSQFYFPNFTTFSLSYWRPILITPEG